jgi:secondary thiamine-phosphate synthase enzyme
MRHGNLAQAAQKTRDKFAGFTGVTRASSLGATATAWCISRRVSSYQEQLEVDSPGRGLVNITRAVEAVVARSGVSQGLCHVFVQHTSASLIIQENADPAVQRDLLRFFDELVPESRAWEHDDEGPDDMPAHAKAVLTKTSEMVPVRGGRLGLGTWQGLYLFEHRRAAHRRTILVTLIDGLGAPPRPGP